MKKFILSNLLGIVCFLAFLSSCSIDKSITEEFDLLKNEQFSEFQDPLLNEFLENNNIKNAKVIPWKEGYLLDDCIYLSKEELEKRSNIESPKHFGNKRINQSYTTWGLINASAGSVRNITYRFHPLFPTSVQGMEWRNAIKNSFDHYSNIRNINISFSETQSTNQEILITSFNNDGTDIIATATLPFNGQPGNSIEVNFAFSSQFNLNQKTYVAVHEIGHIIGLHHTDWQVPDANPLGIPGILINGTWDIDPLSIMNHVYSGQQFNWFPWSDLLAVRTLYTLDLNEKPAYAYIHNLNKNWNWFNTWQGYISNNFEYSGVNGYVYQNPRPNTVPIYKYFSQGSGWYYTTTNPSDVNSSWTSQGLLGYGFNSPGPGRIPIYEYYSPSRGFFFSTQNPSQHAINNGFSYSRIAYYTLSLE